MIRILALVFGNIWMLPNSLVSALYLGVFRLFGQVHFRGFGRWSIQLEVRKDSWLWRYMGKGGWNGWASGVFIIMRDFYDKGVIHEERHVIQQMIFGVFQPITYFLASVFIWVFYRSKHSYYDNPYERDARKAAGQQVDIPKSWWKDPNDRWAWW